MSSIPSEEEFERALQKMAERHRNLNLVSAGVKKQFAGRIPVHDFYILWQPEPDFRAYVFFEKDADVERFKKDGTTSQIENIVYEELERAGRGKRGEILVAFEYDSDENVRRNYEGNYFLRLR